MALYKIRQHMEDNWNILKKELGFLVCLSIRYINKINYGYTALTASKFIHYTSTYTI